MASVKQARRKSKGLEPISIEELMEAPGMSGFVSFLENVPPHNTGAVEKTGPIVETTRVTNTPPEGETSPGIDAVGVLEVPSDSKIELVFETPSVFEAHTDTDSLGVLEAPRAIETGPIAETVLAVNAPPVTASPDVLEASAGTGVALEMSVASEMPTDTETARVTVAAQVEEAAPVELERAGRLETPRVVEAAPAITVGPVSRTPGVSIRTVSAQIAKRFQPLEGARVQPAKYAQQGHTAAEQLIHNALCDAAEEQGSPNEVRVGNRWIMRRTGLSERTVQLNLKSLQLKLSIELVRRHDPDTNEPATWRVYTLDEVLARRKAKGLDMVAKKRGGGVRLVASAAPPVSGAAPK